MIVCRVLSNMKKNFQISEKDIALFVSGELSPVKEKLVQDAIDRDQDLRAYISKLQQVDEFVLKEFSQDYPIPDEFRDLVRGRLEASELSIWSRLVQKLGLVSLFSGSLGAGIAVVLMSMFATPVMLTRSVPDSDGPIAPKQINYGEALPWDVHESLLIKAYAYQRSGGLQKLLNVQNQVQTGDKLQIELLPLVQGEVLVNYISMSGTQEIFKAVVTKGQEQLLFEPHSLPTFKGNDKDEIKVFFNKDLKMTYRIKVNIVN
jgi:hypothetical protein